jgi:hypothetical protein
MYPTFGSWGGSSVFVHQFVRALRQRGYRAVFDLKGKVDVVALIDPRADLLNKSFGMEDILQYRKKHPNVKILHRINECDQRKGTAFMDEALRQANAHADYTVFISDWLSDYFTCRWFDARRVHATIYNGAEEAVFHPKEDITPRDSDVFRLVTHHWSANPMKGFPLYKQLDDLIAEGHLSGVELWVIGNWPPEISWRTAKTFPPTSGHRLAELLCQCHAYITASLWEPCGMHHVEGAQCGLPLLYHEDGGGIVEAGKKYGIGFREESLVAAIKEMRASYPTYRQKVLQHMPSGRQMAMEYVRVVQHLMADVA